MHPNGNTSLNAGNHRNLTISSPENKNQYYVHDSFKIGSRHVHESPKLGNSQSVQALVSPAQNRGHNPIINPMPFATSNPYILKEIQKYGQKR
mmetsp:Transcript_16168/g.13725  ORF Transcript_16168/g.13725 Transcript_16168/m.13725 type:complete len:93 (-) Transcript_16168:348-626(-)